MVKRILDLWALKFAERGARTDVDQDSTENDTINLH